MIKCKGLECEIYWNCTGGCGCGRDPICGAIGRGSIKDEIEKEKVAQKETCKNG